MTTVAADPCGITLDEAWREWLNECFSAPKKARTRRQYALTMRRVTAYLKAGARDVATVTARDYVRALRGLWEDRSDHTWNANRATVMSFLRWMREDEEDGYPSLSLPKRCKAREIKADRTKAVDVEDLDILWEPGTAALRERTLWRCAYESSSRAEALLSLDVERIEWGKQRAAVVQKGGETVYLHFGEMGMELLRELVGDRKTGPVFLTDRRPWNWRDRARADRGPGDRCRLSYNRAEEMFKETTRRLALAEEGLSFDFLTLHRLRSSRLTHLAEDGVDTPILQAISGHSDPRTLHRHYTGVGSRAVRRTMAQADRRERERRRDEQRQRPGRPRPRTRQGRLASRRLRR
ncbi:tyrosine-type recombinase/integrase [Streptomyces albogriseolus]|uniref:tyrosine-type recombinase/integrase n=1 Tax=Streptomyces albogriseolus TaxID=1887 RepID=UPI003460DB21